MVYLISIAAIIGLSIWLWGERATKSAIKWILGGFAGLIVVAVVALMAHEAKRAQDKSAQESALLSCHAKVKAAYNARPECARHIITRLGEDAYHCRINWDLQNDLGGEAKAEWEVSGFLMRDGCEDFKIQP